MSIFRIFILVFPFLPDLSLGMDTVPDSVLCSAGFDLPVDVGNASTYRHQSLANQIESIRKILPINSVTTTEDFRIYFPDEARNGRYLSFSPPGARESIVLIATDGQASIFFANVLRESANQMNLRIILLGIDHIVDQRAAEYTSPVNFVEFQRVEKYYVFLRQNALNLVPGLEKNRVRFLTFGFSNGAIFALRHGLRHGELYAGALAFSVPRQDSGKFDFAVGSKTFQIFLGAGSRETPFKNNIESLAEVFRQNGLMVSTNIIPLGYHNAETWNELLELSLAKLQ